MKIQTRKIVLDMENIRQSNDLCDAMRACFDQQEIMSEFILQIYATNLGVDLINARIQF